MFQTIVIIILLVIIVYLIFDKKGIKADDVKTFLKNTGTKTKEKVSACFERARDSFNTAREEAEKKEQEERSKQKDQQKTSCEEEKSDNLTFSPARKFGFFKTLCCVILIVCTLSLVYKKTMLDYSGEYAKKRLIYDTDCGFCLLITYYPQYRGEDSKGFVVTNIPSEDLVEALFEPLFEVDKTDRYGNNIADSKDLLDSYQILATLGDNALVDSLAKLFLDSKISTRSIQIGKYGNYFATRFEDCLSYLNSVSNSIDNISNGSEKEKKYSTEDDYSPLLIRP